MNSLIWSVVGISAAFLSMSSFIHQILKTIRTKSAKDLSWVALFQLSIGVTLWLAYGVHLKDTIIIVANGFTLIILINLLFLYFYYGRRKA